MSASPLEPEADEADDGQKAARCDNTGATRSHSTMSQSKSNSVCAEQESIDTDPTDDFPSDTGRLGVDGEGCTHYFSRIATTIYVVDGDDVVYTRDDISAGGPLAGWIDHIADERGWTSTNIYESFPEAFVAQLEVEG